MCPGDSRARNLAPDRSRALCPGLDIPARKYPKLILSLAAAGSATAAAVITLSGASAGQLASRPVYAAQRAAHPAAAAAEAPATFRPIATLDAAATSQRATAQRTAVRMLGHFGWTKRQWGPLRWLWNRESGWNKYATNPYSGAYGIPQAVPGSKMASAGNHWRTNATTQIRWGLRYIKSRYGNAARGLEITQQPAYGWY